MTTTSSHFAVLIREAGVVKPWPRDAPRSRYHHTYLELDGWEYWTMADAVDKTEVINRASVAQPEQVERPRMIA